MTTLQEKIAAFAAELEQLVTQPQRMHDEAAGDIDKEGEAYEQCAKNLTAGVVEVFNLMAGEMGVTGFQASFAINRAWAQIAGVEGPVMFLKAEDYLYPQYDGRVTRFVANHSLDYLKAQAVKKLTDGSQLAPRVRERMEDIVAADGGWDLTDGGAY